MSDIKLVRRVDQFARALDRLREVVAMEASAPLVTDAAMQRFEFTFELAWKCLKAAVEASGAVAPMPREAIKQAFAAGWITDEALWLSLMKARNESSHIYDEAAALRIFELVRSNMPAFEEALVAMRDLAARLEP